MIGITIGDKHTYDDFGLLWLEPYTIDYPAPQYAMEQVPYRDGAVDFTEDATGDVAYGTRTATLVFEVQDADYYQYEDKKRQLAEYLHGKRYPMILDTDPGYYYDARYDVSFGKDSKVLSELTVVATAQPYKLKLADTVVNIAVPSAGTITTVLPNERKRVAPQLTANGAVTIYYLGTSYAITAGSVTIPELRIVPGTSEIRVDGTSGRTLSIRYREGAL
jgi:hypothetical protein